MNLPAFCIRRPAFTIVISLVMTIVGIIGFKNLPVRWIPNINPPVVSIFTLYPGANAQLVEKDVTKIIEDSLSGIDGIETLTSNSRQGASDITITFKLGRDMNAAVEDVRGSIERIRGGLPKEIENPMVAKADPNSYPIMYISFYDTERDARALSDYIDQYVLPAFETTDGVGQVAIYGKRASTMYVHLDPNKMAGANVTADDVAQLLQSQNASVPSGEIRGNDRDYSVVTETTLRTPEQFNNVIVRADQNQIVRIKDIGNAQLGVQNSDSAVRVSGRPAIALGIIPQTMANPLDVEKSVQKTFKQLKKTLPSSMQASIIYSQADYIRASIHSVYESFFEAVIFVWIIIFAFLCNFRASLIPIITIPVCLISTFAILYFLGFSINTITLMAFVLAIGLVVDDAIVMLENISRHIEAGQPVLLAAFQGSKEIIVPIIAMTLTLAAVYAPIAFTPGLLGVLFREFTFTLAGAVLISGVVALTLTPMMCSRILKSKHQESRYSTWVALHLSRLQQQYRYFLGRLLNKRKRVLLSLLIVAGLGLGVYHLLPAELAPNEDMSEVNVFVSAPRSASFQYTDNYVRQLETIFSNTPDVNSYISLAGMPSRTHAYQILMLKPPKERKHSIEEIVATLTAEVDAIPGVRVNVFTPPPPLAQVVAGDEGDRNAMVVMTASDYKALQHSTQQVAEVIKSNPGFMHAEDSLKWDGEQYQVTIDKDKAADLKIPVAAISNTISTLLSGRKVGKIDDMDVMVQMPRASLADPAIFQQLYARNLDNKIISLSGLLDINVVSSPESYKHFDRLRADAIYFMLAPNYKMADAVANLQKVAKKILPANMKYVFTGEARSFLESNHQTSETFLLALIFIYLVMVAQFESFIDPLIIMFTVPFAMVGAMLTLKVFGGTLNIYSNIGLITLVGLIAKHGILITEFANRLRREGFSILEAVTEAAALRLRPILMTTAAMVLGALPLAFATGPGAESRQQVGLVIAGGLLFGTFFSLIVVPVAYTYLAPFRKIQQEEVPTKIEFQEGA